MRRQLFSLVVLVTLGLSAFIGIVLVRPDAIDAVIGRTAAGHMSHFREPHHRIHDLAFAFLISVTMLGTIAQLRRPSRSAAAQVMAAIPILGLALVSALTNAAVVQVPWVLLGAPTLLATALHPAVGDLVRSVRIPRIDRALLALVVVAALPLLVFASTNVGLQTAGPTDHALLGHYGFMAAFGFTVVGLGLLSSVRPAGGRVVPWAAGLLPVLLGVASLAFPDVESSLDLVWALAAIGWGVAFVTVAERRARGDLRRV